MKERARRLERMRWMHTNCVREGGWTAEVIVSKVDEGRVGRRGEGEGWELRRVDRKELFKRRDGGRYEMEQAKRQR